MTTQKPEGANAGALSFAEHLEKLDAKERVFVVAYMECFNRTQAARVAKLGKTPESTKQIGYQTYRRPHVRAAIEAGFNEAGMGAAEVVARVAEIAQTGFESLLTEVKYTEPVYENIPTGRYIHDLELQQGKHEHLASEFAALNPKKAQRHRRTAQEIQEQVIELRAELSVNPDHTVRRQVGVQRKTRLELDLVKAREAGKLHLVQKLAWTKEGPSISLESKLKALELLGKHHKLWADRMEHEGGLTITLKKETVGDPLD